MQILNAGNRFFLEGSVSTPEDIDRALELAQSLLPNIENHIAVPIKIDPTITMRIFILELSRRAHEVLGLSWPASVNPLASIQPGLTTFSPSWTLMLKHLATKGQAKILSEPVLSVKNGAKAELSAGGEIPLKIVGRYENKVTWKHYGLKVGIHIHGIAGKFIRTQIATESSQLDESTAVDGVPGIRSNKMSTLIDAREGQAVMLTGLFQSSASKDVEKMPLLGNIPILGELFKSREFRERDSELIVAILPSFGANETSLPLKSARGLEFDKHWHLWD